MQKILTAFSSDVEHIVIKKISFTHFFESIVIEESIIFAFTFSKKNSVFNTALEVINQMIKKLAQTVIKNIF